MSEEIKEREQEDELDEFAQAEYAYDSPVRKIRKIMEITGWNQKKMGEILKVSQAQISQYLSGKSEMSMHVKDFLANIFSRVKGGLILRGFTKNGGKVRMEQIGGGISATSHNLNDREIQAVAMAQLTADPINEGSWAEAEAILREAGFKIYYE